MSGTTPSQTVGPYLHIGLTWPDGAYAVPAAAPGGFWIRGVLTDGAERPVSDGLIETWQADPDGGFAHAYTPEGSATPRFRGFGRCPTGGSGEFGVFTRKPGRVPGPAGPQAPHIDVSVFARGMLNRVVTRLYFPDEPEANAADPVLTRITDPAARATLVAGTAEDGYRFDIRLQGEHETVFFDI
ncbi:protocatechuate 3,4-dioxygenase alpha subunit [Haloactinospora alba]|uniref:Protocatechuate 3,4-dioxygenase alpha subunit n=1 Tax=Haloactinospora alba TaxID=405555 RepID=A0A543NH05_9ACTN|nr:protocatechuate 3,4-dioxygenase subunit alpha [Haloactinospora alba]TQN31127.1 protocatechuate 3,4-dioxygenase alpha subunit [Haloactinospora alba]